MSKEVDQRFRARGFGLGHCAMRMWLASMGKESHFGAIDPELDSHPVREFGSWTAAMQCPIASPAINQLINIRALNELDSRS